MSSSKSPLRTSTHFSSLQNFSSASPAFKIQRQRQPCFQYRSQSQCESTSKNFVLLMPSRRASSLSSALSTISQILVWSQRTYCFLLTCVILFNFAITGGEPQKIEETTKLQPTSPYTASAAYFHDSMVATQTSSRHSSSREDYSDSIISQMSPQPSPPLPSNPPLYTNQSTDVISGENTASVIASSFRNFENPQLSNSKEEPGTTNYNQSQRNRTQPRDCDTIVLKRCLDGLPPMNATGIPSTPQAVETACRIYNKGINCFDSWAKHCLPEKQRQRVKASITGAHEMYTFLCKDPKFRADYLKHKTCYRKLSPHWDDCSRQFIDGLKRNTRHNHTAFCCVRLEFLTCVSRYSSYSCSLEASRFLMKMAETLVRSTIRKKSDAMDYCVNVHLQNCIPIAESIGRAATTAQSALMILIISSVIAAIVPSSNYIFTNGIFHSERGHI